MTYEEVNNWYAQIEPCAYVCVIMELKQQEERSLLSQHAFEQVLHNVEKTCQSFFSQPCDFHCLLPQSAFLFLWKTRKWPDIYHRISMLDDAFLDVSFSFGICYLEEGFSLFQAVAYARMAAHSSTDYAKYTTSIEIYDTLLQHHVEKKMSLQMQIEMALRNEHLQVYIQPKIYCWDQRLYGGEALIRWRYLDHMIPLSDFMPIIQKNSFIRQIDLYVLEHVCAFLQKCKQQHLPQLPISINISKASFHDREHYVCQLQQFLSQYHIDPSRLEFEISEDIISCDNKDLLQFLGILKSLGVLISIDDFGSGSASLSALSTLEIDTIKLDQSFFRHPLNTSRRILLYHLLCMLKQLHFQIVAEGVESIDYIWFLRQHGCDLIQGYYFYKPMELSAYEALLRKHIP